MTHDWRPAALAATLLLAVGAAGSAADPIDSVMDRTPVLPVPTLVKVFPKRQAEALLLALERPDSETKCAAALTITTAHAEGMPGLAAATVPGLVRELDRPGQPPEVRTAVAHTLVALDARQTADSLFRQLEGADPAYREVVEPALGRWGHAPVRTTWLDRIAQPPPYRRQHMLAIRELGVAREEKAVAGLRALVQNPKLTLPVRLEAARALASVKRSGLEADAAALATPTGSATDRLLAASLLRHHQGDETLRQLQILSRDSDPTVAEAALARFAEIAPKPEPAVLDSALASPDANVRGLAVALLFRHPSDRHIRLLAGRLSDPHPEVRTKARVALRDIAAAPTLRPAVIVDATGVLAGSDWRGQEQAAYLLAQLDHKPASKRLLEVLSVERPEAFVAAAWALRQLAVPETLQPITNFLRAQNQAILKLGPTGGRRGDVAVGVDDQLSQLAQFLGQARYAKADIVLRDLVPRFVTTPKGNSQTPVGNETRTAAIWALGMIHEHNSAPEVVSLAEERLADVPMGPPGPEADRIRAMSAITIGRLKGRSALESLRQYYAKGLMFNQVNNSCGWAIEQITGEPLPRSAEISRTRLGWFLMFVE